MPYYIHAEDPSPGLEIELNEEDHLINPQWYVVEWATDRSLFNTPFGRTESNFYRTEFELGRHRSQYSLLPPERWSRLRSARLVYVRVGAGDKADENDPSWDWDLPRELQVNHDPVANAGTPVQLSLDTGGVIPESVILDAGGSSDEDDGTTLSYEWQLAEAAPDDVSAFHDPTFQQFINTIRTQLQGTAGATTTVFPMGTVVPPIAHGQYTFKLMITDNDPPSQKSGRIGKDQDEVVVTIIGSITDLELLAPTTSSPKRVYRVPDDADSGVVIEWQMSSELLTEAQSQIGLIALRLSVRQHDPNGSGAEVYTDYELLRSRTYGSFIWSLIDTRSGQNNPTPRGVYDVVLEVVNSAGQQVSLSGRTTEAEELGAIDVDRPGYWADRYLEDIEVEDNVFRGELIVGGFDINEISLQPDHKSGLNQFLSNRADDIVIDSIVGRASQTGPELNNVQLSIGRANAIAHYLIQNGLESSRIFSVEGVGSSQPLFDDPGREWDINRSAEINFRAAHYVPPQARVPPTPKPNKPKSSHRWAIKFLLSWDVGLTGVIGGVIGQLARLRSTGDVNPNDQASIKSAIEEWRIGWFIGFGLGAGLSPPAAGGPWTDWSYFETNAYEWGFPIGEPVSYTIDDFDPTLAIVMSADGGFIGGGIAVSYITFPLLGSGYIDTGGFVMGNLFLSGSLLAGEWWLS